MNLFDINMLCRRPCDIDIRTLLSPPFQDMCVASYEPSLACCKTTITIEQTDWWGLQFAESQQPSWSDRMDCCRSTKQPHISTKVPGHIMGGFCTNIKFRGTAAVYVVVQVSY